MIIGGRDAGKKGCVEGWKGNSVRGQKQTEILLLNCVNGGEREKCLPVVCEANKAAFPD